MSEAAEPNKVAVPEAVISKKARSSPRLKAVKSAIISKTGPATTKKRATTLGKSSKTRHPGYLEMIRSAILAQKDKPYSSRHAIFKWIQANHPNIDPKQLSFRGNLAIRSGIASGLLKTGKSAGVFRVADKKDENEKASVTLNTKINVKKAAESKSTKSRAKSITSKKVVKKISTKAAVSAKQAVKKAAPPKRKAPAPKHAPDKKIRSTRTATKASTNRKASKSN